MPKRRSGFEKHRADTCRRAIRRECRAWGVKRHQFDAAVAFLRIQHGGMPALSRAVQHAALLYFDEKKFEKRLHGSWARDAKYTQHRNRSSGYVRKKTHAFGVMLFTYRKAKPRSK